jgi:ATP-dependent RNA helicase DDX3X
MSTWNTDDMALALPEAAGDARQNEVSAQPAAEPTNPNKAQEFGWAPKVAYDYESYVKSNKELMEAQAAFTGNKPSASFLESDLGSKSFNTNETFTDCFIRIGEDPDVAVGGVKLGQWASDAAVYEWTDEYGDVGPRFAELEKQLFGAENHVRSGENFEG